MLGLLIAIGLEQAVEYFHHRREVAEARKELRARSQQGGLHRRDQPLTVGGSRTGKQPDGFGLQKHPGTPDEKLPGSLVWFHNSSGHRPAIWDAAKSRGVTSLMRREEVEQYEVIYNQLTKIDDARLLAWDALNNASRYEFTDSRLSHRSPAQIGEITTLTHIALNKHWLEGVGLQNAAQEFQDFPPSVTTDELSRVHNRKKCC